MANGLVKRLINKHYMPLIKSTSKQAFAKNIATEMRAGRPQKQSIAIAYSEKRAAQKAAHHSDHSAKRSRHYHSRVIEGTPIDRGARKMTRQAARQGKIE